MIDGALFHLANRHFASSITLAGAAEGQLFPLADNIDLFAGLRKHLAGLTEREESKIADDFLNYVRNGLKHKRRDFDWSRVNEFEAVIALLRPLLRYSVHHTIQQSTIMVEFWKSLIESGAQDETFGQACIMFRSKMRL